MNVLSIQNIAKTVDDRPLFSEVTLGLDAGEKVGIVGRNGAGKTTFLKVLRGLVHQDEGTIAMAGGSNMVTLEQNVTYSPSATIRNFLYEADHPSTRLLCEYHEALESGDERLSQRLQAEIDRLDLWNLENDFKTYLTRFGMKYDLNHEMKTLSGGELKKVAIARMFTLRPTIMLLDEPTNHLDIRTIKLLEKDLQNTSAAVIIVTHDRYILNSVCTTIWELDGGRFYRHPGNYEAYLERRAERIQMLQKEQDRLASILRRELIWLARGPQARTGKDKNRKERIETMLSQVKNVQDARQTSFSSLERRLGKKILDLKHVSRSFDGRTLFEDFSYSFKKGDRIGVVADNGMGKSTLLDIVAGVIEPDSGMIDRGVNTHIAYYDQLGRTLPMDKSALDFLEDISSRVLFCGGEISAERLLELFGFSRAKMRTLMSVYSGGERRRVYLISRLMENPNFLILDEPTNDLDIPTMENLEEYIASFPGCCLIVSHDRAFLNCTCTSLFVIQDGKVLDIPTTYAQWKEGADARPRDQATPKTDTVQRPRREQKGLTFKEHREFETMEAEIEEMEQEKVRLEAGFTDIGETEDGTLAQRTRRYEELVRLIDEKTERYFVLAEKAQS